MKHALSPRLFAALAVLLTLTLPLSPVLAAESTEAPLPSETPASSAVPGPSDTPAPSDIPEPSDAPAPSAVPEPSDTPAPSVVPEPSDTPAPSAVPEPSDTSDPTETPVPENTPVPSESPEPAETSEPTQTPVPTETPIPSDAVFSIVYRDYTGAVLDYDGPASYTPANLPLTLPRPVRADRIFAGWTGTELAGQTLDVTIPAGSFGDREYTAHWYTVGGVPESVYTGQPVLPAVSVWQDDVRLLPGSDYTLTGGNNLDAGTATLTITGTQSRPGLYAVRAFVIRPAAVRVGGITAFDKPYDGTTDARLDVSGAVLSGVMPGDELTVTASGVFVGPSAGERRVVILSDLSLLGPRSYNYVLDPMGQQRTAVAAIYPAELSGVSAGQKGTMTDRSIGHRPAVTVTGRTVDGTPVLFTFSLSPDGPYAPLPPVLREAGEYTVYYRASAPNHTRVQGSFPVTVGRGAPMAPFSLAIPLTRATSGTYTIDLTLDPDRSSARTLSLTVTPKGARERHSVLTLSLTDRVDGQDRTRPLREGADFESRYLFDARGNLLLTALLLPGENMGTLAVEFDLPEYHVCWYPGWHWTDSLGDGRPTADAVGEPLRFFDVKVNNHLQDRAGFRLDLNGEEILLSVDDGGTAASLTTAAEPLLRVGAAITPETAPDFSVTGALSRWEAASALREGTDFFLRSEEGSWLLTFVGTWRCAVTLSW